MTLSPNDDFMIQTSHPEIYEELKDKRKLFKTGHHIFTSGLAVGVLNNVRSANKPHHDLVKIGSIKDTTSRSIIDFMFVAVCKGSTEQARWADLLAIADGGLEVIWKEYQAQNYLDIPRILEEAKKRWPDRAKELIKQLEGM